MENEQHIVPLTEIKVGTLCRVADVTSRGAVRQRMLSLGLVPGIVLEVVRYAPMGDPIEIRIKRFFMSLRREEAIQVMVLPMGECPRRGSRFGRPGHPFGRGRRGGGKRRFMRQFDE